MPLLVALILAVAPGIRTPSGNIDCFASHGTLRCQITQAVYRLQLQHQCVMRASLDGHGFELSRTERGTPSCSGGIILGPPRYRTLAYGRTWSTGGVTCTSRITGLTCTAGAHGIFISRQSWRGW
jgi:hypothetical protein